MAEAKEISGLDCNASAIDWARQVLEVRFSEVLDLRVAAQDFSEVETVHDMRVAIRRLRGALRDFLPLLKKRFLRNVRKDLKQFADALGAVRDEDVAIIALKKMLTGIGNEQIKEGVENFLARRNALREQNRVNLTEILTSKTSQRLERDFLKSLERSIKNSPLTFNQAGRSAVSQSLDHFLELGVSLYNPFNAPDLHELRIAAKRLRYALELFTACWGASIKIFADEIAAMQSALGEVHDCDVWIDGLSDLLLGDSGATTESEYQTAIWLLSEFTKRRTK
ncbi:MAG: CHAD domain-containing protein, partial [Pyrinomonadaceae bacterium]